MYESFAGKHAVITGGSSGIGLALVRLLVAANARVSALALDDADLDRLAAEELPGVVPVPVDVTDREAVVEAVSRAGASHGPPYLLVTCAGVVRPGYFTELPAEEFEREMQVNYFGTLWAARAVVPSMVERGSGTIMSMSSFAGLTGVFGYTAYCPSKFAVRGLCESLRIELRPKGIHVGCIFPGDADTPMLAAEVPQKPPEAQASGMLPVLSAEDVAHAILRGAERRKARVFPGRRTSALARVAMAMPGLAGALNDRDVARHTPGRRQALGK
jgi:3-dehydrosphinganine reductase